MVVLGLISPKVLNAVSDLVLENIKVNTSRAIIVKLTHSLSNWVTTLLVVSKKLSFSNIAFLILAGTL